MKRNYFKNYLERVNSINEEPLDREDTNDLALLVEKLTDTDEISEIHNILFSLRPENIENVDISEIWRSARDYVEKLADIIEELNDVVLGGQQEY